jgi:hypothetical protein
MLKVLSMYTSSIRPGQRRMATVYGRPQPVRILHASRYNPNYWLCVSELTGEFVALPEFEFGAFLPERAEGAHAAARS